MAWPTISVPRLVVWEATEPRIETRKDDQTCGSPLAATIDRQSPSVVAAIVFTVGNAAQSQPAVRSSFSSMSRWTGKFIFLFLARWSFWLGRKVNECRRTSCWIQSPRKSKPSREILSKRRRVKSTRPIYFWSSGLHDVSYPINKEHVKEKHSMKLTNA